MKIGYCYHLDSEISWTFLQRDHIQQLPLLSLMMAPIYSLDIKCKSSIVYNNWQTILVRKRRKISHFKNTQWSYLRLTVTVLKFYYHGILCNEKSFQFHISLTPCKKICLVTIENMNNCLNNGIN